MNNYAFRMNFSRSGPSPKPSPKPGPKPIPKHNPNVALESNPNPHPHVALASNPNPHPVTRDPIAPLAPLAPITTQTDRFSMSRLIHFKATGGCRSCS